MSNKDDEVEVVLFLDKNKLENNNISFVKITLGWLQVGRMLQCTKDPIRKTKSKAE